MSRARPIIEGASLMITRRVRGRQFLLKPSERLTQLVAYVVAVMAERHGILLHALCVLSNHYHLICSDPRGTIAKFTHDCHELIARYLNAQHGDFENFWNTSQTSHVQLEEPSDIIGKIAYTMANPLPPTPLPRRLRARRPRRETRRG